ncbi:MAG TPA: hypothetical protein VF422_00075 [Dokdonella sp.]
MSATTNIQHHGMLAVRSLTRRRAPSIVTLLAALLAFLVERPALRMIRNAWKHRRALVPA